MITLKNGVRSIGIDDGPFNSREKRKSDVLVVGAVYRGGTWFDGLLTTKIRRDGWNATTNLIQMLKGSKFLPQLRYAILDGIALGGFNIIDLDRFHLETGLKILVTVRKRPNLEAMKNAISHLGSPRKRMALLRTAGDIIPIDNLYCNLKGMDIEEAKALLRLTCTRSHLPEPVRVAHLIAGGVKRGQSGRKA